MKNNKITAEEQVIDKLGKLYSERKACRQKRLAILCPLGRQMCITYTYYLCSSNWDRQIARAVNDFATPQHIT